MVIFVARSGSGRSAPPLADSGLTMRNISGNVTD
jgi:hypothetical protein